MRYNVVYIHSHDSGRYLEPYVKNVSTPAIARFAQQAVVFGKAFCAAPTCSPSRAAMLTGMWAHESGMIGLAHRGFRLFDFSKTLMNHLSSHGYDTVLAAGQHIVNPPKQPAEVQAAGWQRRLPPPQELGSQSVEAVKYLLTQPQEPFFLDVGYFYTHRVFPQASAASAIHAQVPPFLPDNPVTRQDWADYCLSASQLDGHVEHVLGAIDAAGLSERTIVVLTTDHGVAFPNAKCNLTDHGIGVALMMRGPGVLAANAGRRLDAMVSQVDVLPTLCELLDLPQPAWALRGTSMVDLIAGRTSTVRDELFAEVTYHAAYEPQRCVRTQRYKYIRRFDDRKSRVLPNCDDSASKTHLMELGWANWNLEQEQLFDLAHDPQESRNLAADPVYGAALADMRGRLERWMRETSDPLLAGPVPLPAGAIANLVDGLSATEEEYLRG